MNRVLIIMVFALITGCAASIDGSRYTAITPDFKLESFFQGEVKAWGIVQNRSREVTQRFEVTILGELKNGELVLDETFSYGLGEGVEKRIWRIRQPEPGKFKGNASDIVGDATGTAHGNAMNWVYTMNLPVGDSTYQVRFDDWFWAFDENTIMNRSYIRKFGITFAEVTLFMQKQ